VYEDQTAVGEIGLNTEMMDGGSVLRHICPSLDSFEGAKARLLHPQSYLPAMCLNFFVTFSWCFRRFQFLVRDFLWTKNRVLI
jgi:hypothetical protein